MKFVLKQFKHITVFCHLPFHVLSQVYVFHAKGAVTPGTLFCNLSGNFVAIQVARKIARRNIPCRNPPLREVEVGSTFRNDPRNAATSFFSVA